MRIFEGVVEGAAEGVGACCGGDEEVRGRVRTGRYVVAGWRAAFRRGGGEEEVGVFPV